jgi:hypothetical protein
VAAAFSAFFGERARPLPMQTVHSGDLGHPFRTIPDKRSG